MLRSEEGSGKVVNLQALFPGKLEELAPDRLAQELMRLFLVRTNLVPSFRFALGWRGVAPACDRGEGDGWTARIRGYQGVFGVRFKRPEWDDRWRGGIFHLAYFPRPEEDLLEKVSLAAAAVAHGEAYEKVIRAFTAYPDVTALFDIGRIHLAWGSAEGALALGLQARSRDRTRARDGLTVVSDGGSVPLIAPGGIDRDFPARAVADAFFETLAASVTFNLQTPPSHLAEAQGPGTEQWYDRDGAVWSHPAADCRDSILYLGYGMPADPSPPTALGQDEAFGLRWMRLEAATDRYAGALWRVAHRTQDIKSIDKQALGIDDRPTLIVLTGFLGAGKTSFLQHFIEHQVRMNRFVAVIQNEIGAVGLDGKLVAEDVAVTEMDEGCVCCSLIGNLKSAVGRLLSEFHPDIVVLETTGLANPFNLLEDLDELQEQVRFDSVTTVVDAAEAAATLDRYAVAQDQVRAADILLINKIDLVGEKVLEGLRARLAALNARATVVSATQGSFPPGLLYGTDPLETGDGASEASRRLRADHRPTHRRDGIQSFKCDLSTPLDRETFLNTITQKIPATVLRIKGILELCGHSTPFVFQYVGGRWDLSPFNNPNVQERFLVFIGADLDPDGLRADLLGDPSRGCGQA